MAQFHTTTPTVASVVCLQCSGTNTWMNPVTNATVVCPLCQGKGVTHNTYHVIGGKYKVLYNAPAKPKTEDLIAPTIHTS